MSKVLPLNCIDVSRETSERLMCFERVLLKWNPRINLVSRNSLEGFWERHVEDSAQVFKGFMDEPGSSGPLKWVDLGSGGGFPGLIVAILAAQHAPNCSVTLVESDQRKSAFLRSAARECDLEVRVLSKRIEQIENLEADVLSARALADLDQLLEFAEMHLKPDGIALFPKGAKWKKEVDNAAIRWRFDHVAIKSLTEEEAVVLKIKGVSRV